MLALGLLLALPLVASADGPNTDHPVQGVSITSQQTGVHVVIGFTCADPNAVVVVAGPDFSCQLPAPTVSPSPTTSPTVTVTPTATATPQPSATATATPIAGVTSSIVFTSRKILPNGAVTLASAADFSGVGPISRFRITVGKLLIRRSDGSIQTLIDGTQPTAATLNLVDVNAPAVSWDARTILFSGVPAANYPASASQMGAAPGAWRLYSIGVDGSNLHQVTFSDQHLDLSQFGLFANALANYDDTDPAWLPDGRIVFSSTRYPEIAQYNGDRATNLFIVNADGSALHRITTEKNGADRPIVDPLTGQIVYARWWRNNHFPVNSMATITDTSTIGGYQQKDGLTINPADSVGDGLNRNFWVPAAINPDGTGLRAWRLDGRSFGLNQYYGGVFTALRQLISNYIPDFPITQESGFGGLRLLTHGTAPYVPILGVTDPVAPLVVPNGSFGVPTGPYASDADVLPDGRLIVSWAADTGQDYGLSVVNADGSGRTLLYDSPGTAEARAKVLVPRPVPPIIPDIVTHIASALPPLPGATAGVDGVFTFQDLNVYANAPVDAGIVTAPGVGTAALIRYFINQQGPHNSSTPQLEWPTQFAAGVVNPDGSLINTSVPADVPTFEQLRAPDGTVPTTGGGGAAQVFGQNFGRPGVTVQCVGCHAGHSLMPVPSNPADALWTNLAPGATVTVSSAFDASKVSGLIDLKVQIADLRAKWYTAPGQMVGQWVQLTFPVPVTVRSVRLYNPRFGPGGQSSFGTVQNTIQVTGATVQLFSDAAATQQVGQATAGALLTAGTDVLFPDTARVRAVRVRIDSSVGTISGLANQPVTGLAQIEVIARAG